MTYPNAAGHRGDPTSREAANKIDTQTLCRLVYGAVEEHWGKFGEPISPDAIALDLEIHWNSIRPRVTQLIRLGKLKITDRNGFTIFGNRCYRVAPRLEDVPLKQEGVANETEAAKIAGQ